MATPQLDVDAGAVSDTSGNAVSATSDQTITIQDTIKPTFSSASYKTGSGELKITFSEALDSSKHVATKFHIRESGQSSGGVTLSNGTITANGTSSLTITLSTANRNSVAGMATPQLDVDAGAIHDAAGNAIAESSDLPISIASTLSSPPSLPLSLPSPLPSPDPADQPVQHVPKAAEFFVELDGGENMTGSIALGDLHAGVPIVIFLIDPDGDLVSSGLMSLALTPGIFVPNATLDLEISPYPTGDMPGLPSTPYLFFDVNIPEADFSDPASFSENGLPRIKFTVPTTSDIPEMFADGCPVPSAFLYDGGNWTQLGHPLVGGNQIYVTNTLNNSVSIVDIASNEVVKRIKVGADPGGAAFNAQTGMLFVSNAGSGTVTVVDVARHMSTTIEVGALPSVVAVDEVNNMVYVAQAAGMAVINGSSNGVAGSVSVPGAFLDGMAFDFAGMRGYAAGSHNSTMYAVNLSTNTVAGKIDAGGRPAAIGMDPDTGMVYSSVPGLGAVVAVNATTNTLVDTIPVGGYPSGLVFSPHGDRVYAGDTLSNAILVIDARTHNVTRDVPLGQVPHGMAIMQSTNTLYVTSPESGDIVAIDGDTSTVLGSIKAGAGSRAIAVNPSVSNPVRVPFADATYGDGVVECSYAAGLPYLSVFAIGGINRASAPGYGNATDAAPPAFDHAGVPVDINGDAFHMEHFGARNGTQTFGVGEAITMTFAVLEQGGADDLVHFEFLANLTGPARDHSSSDTRLQYDMSGVRVTDPHGYFSSSFVGVYDDGADLVRIAVELTFAKPMASSDVILRMWDEQKRQLTAAIPDMIEIVE